MRNVYGSLRAHKIGQHLKIPVCVMPNEEMEPASERRPNAEKHDQLEDIMQRMPITEEVECGFWCFRGALLQRFAGEKVYLIMYGLVGCILAMTRAYFNGTITTLERRYKIPSRNTGLLTVGDNISQTFLSAILGYYAGRSHRPRWIGAGSLIMVIACLLTAAPHFVYGPGEDALAVTEEYGMGFDVNATSDELEYEATKTLCKESGQVAGCANNEGSLLPQVMLFVSQFIFGIGCALYYTLGLAYLDDNTKKSNSPRMLSMSVALSLMGPAIGYMVSSFCLRVFIAPFLNVIISNKDPRWLGAWWLGWLIFAACLSCFGLFLTMFPRELPRTKARRLLAEQEKLLEGPADATAVPAPVQPATSFADMVTTFRRLLKNKVMMLNTFGTCFYFFGYAPYWYFTPKYIEIQFRQSAVTSTMLTGPIPLVFSILGVLVSGFLISKYKPSARFLAAWNITIDILTVLGMLAYVFIGCAQSENSMAITVQESELSGSCIATCQCDYVRYSPVCGENNLTYLSPCHAGCKNQTIEPHGTTYTNCYCIDEATTTTIYSDYATTLASNENAFGAGTAVNGACAVDCLHQLIIFLVVMCALKTIGSSGRATNMLIMIRCVAPEDKSACMGLGMMLISIFSLIPAPIFFGWLMDSLCLVWGKTCTTQGNCLLYDAEMMRNTLHTTAAAFIFIGTLFNCGVWYYIKDVKIFDEEPAAKRTSENITTKPELQKNQ